MGLISRVSSRTYRFMSPCQYKTWVKPETLKMHCLRRLIPILLIPQVDDDLHSSARRLLFVFLYTIGHLLRHRPCIICLTIFSISFILLLNISCQYEGISYYAMIYIS